MRTPTDTALLRRWQTRRDPDAFGALIDRHAGMVYGASLRILRDPAEAEDVVQHTFLKLSQSAPSQTTSPGGWLHRVATNRARDVVKTRSRRQERETAYADTQQSTTAPDTRAILNELDAALAALPDHLRDPLVAHYLEGLTHKETARRLGLSRSGVTRRIQRGLEALREQLGEHGVAAATAAIAAALTAGRVQAAPPALVASLRKLALSGAAKGASPTTAKIGIPLPVGVAAGVLVLAVLIGIALPRLQQANGSETGPNGEVTRTPLPATDPAPAEPDPRASLAAATAADDATTDEPASAQAATTPSDPEPDDIVLTCVDTNGNPVPGAEVYVVHYSYTIPFMRFPVHRDQLSRTPLGPFHSDDDGRVEIPRPQNIEAVSAGAMAYARVPGERVGA